MRHLTKIKKIEKSLYFFCFWSDFFSVKKKNKLWDISDGLQQFWGQKSFPTIFKIAYYVNTGFSPSILASKTSEFRRQDIFFWVKNHENLKIEFIHFSLSQKVPESDANLKKMFCAWIMGVSSSF